jgi:DNA invertase Pin-like site-specific DNA recombinase
MRAALYLRVSTVRQAEKELSIPDQWRQGEAFCKAKGWSVYREFEERGASATDDRRPVFQEMIEAACRPERDFDIIVVHSFSRFFRDAYQAEFYARKLKRHRVKVVSVTQETSDDPNGELIRKILNLFDEYQSQENGKHTLRAMKENARQRFRNGSPPPFGYRTVEAERRGDKVKRKLEIDPTAEWTQKAKEAQAELREIDERMRRLYDMVERGIAPLDDTLGNRLAELRQRRDEALRLKGMAERQRNMPRQLVDPERIEAFCAAIQEQLLRADVATRKAYLRMFIERIEIDDAEIRMSGSNGALAAGLRHGPEGSGDEVPSLVQGWRPRRDSNPCYRRERTRNDRDPRIEGLQVTPVALPRFEPTQALRFQTLGGCRSPI